jgi:hypothetical protein
MGNRGSERMAFGTSTSLDQHRIVTKYGFVVTVVA